jgi:phage gp46-like protein
MDRALDPNSGDYSGERTDTLQNAVYLRLITPLGAWWADPVLGSLLHTLQREKDLSRISLLAQQYAEEALQAIVRDGRAERISVAATQPHDGRLYLHIQVYTAAGRFDFSHAVNVI